jgi:hypothetical protein
VSTTDARNRAEAIADAACPEGEVNARLDDYAVEVARTERIAAYRAAADELTAAANPTTSEAQESDGLPTACAPARTRWSSNDNRRDCSADPVRGVATAT